MQKLFGRRWWLAALLLAVGCRSEQAAFSFGPAPRIVAPVVFGTPAAPSAPAPTAPSEPAVAAAAPPVAAVSAGSTAPVSAAAPATAQPNWQQLKSSVARLRQPVSRRASRFETTARTSRTDTLHWVLGAALVVAGVVGGLLLGGWLGLGVGAALVLLGYYFVLMALGGRQAWLEVFQEFFNM